ncbi:MAG: hypothetical protein KGI71_04510 [Patescibacteria group bacterium]|nr:hypothetical protein [Patescibacteria group bacterium]
MTHSPDIDDFLASKPFSPNYRKNLLSTLSAAEGESKKALVAWVGSDALAIKGWLETAKSEKRGHEHEPRFTGRSAPVKWGQICSFFSWAAETGRVKVNERTGEALAVAGTEMAPRDDPKKPTLTLVGYAALEGYLLGLTKEKPPRRSATYWRQSEIGRREWERRIAKATFVWRAETLQWRHGLRGGEVVPTDRTHPKQLCDCQGDSAEGCPLRPEPHDFRILQNGLVWIRVKGEPKRIRFKQAVFSEEELGWLPEMIANPATRLSEYDAALKAAQVHLGLKLVDRQGNQVPIANAPLTSHTLRRTLSREMTKLKVPEQTQNKKMGWTVRSMQSRRYGEPSPQEVDDSLKEILDVSRIRRKLAKESTVADAKEEA